MARADQAPQPDNGEEEDATAPSPSDPDRDSYPPPPVLETWNEAVDAVLEATRAAHPTSPPFDAASPGTFQAYWRGVFARLRDEVGAIPDQQLTSPPSRVFWVNVFARDPAADPACPCCLPGVEPSVRLESDSGVTKADLVAGLGRFLYGGGPPRVYVEDAEGEDGLAPEEEEGQRKGVLVHGADWMSEGGGGGDDGRKYVYTGGWIGRPPMIWMYCCQWGEFRAKAAADPENGAEGADESGAMAKL